MEVNQSNGEDGGASSMNAQQEQSNERTEAQQEYAHMKESLDDGGVGDYKTFAILGYILPFLFFLPLLNEKSKNNQFARFHANQHLILFIATILLYMLHSVLYIMFMFGGLFIGQLVNLAFFVFAVMGIIHAAKGEMKEMPIIGGFKLLN